MDGAGHDFEGDEERDRFLESQGYKMLHVPNEVVQKNPQEALRLVKEAAEEDTPTEERVAGVQEPAPAAIKEAPNASSQPLEKIVEELQTGILQGRFTFKDILAKLDPSLTLQLTRAYRETLKPGSQCPVCRGTVGSEEY